MVIEIVGLHLHSDYNHSLPFSLKVRKFEYPRSGSFVLKGLTWAKSTIFVDTPATMEGEYNRGHRSYNARHSMMPCSVYGSVTRVIDSRITQNCFVPASP